MKKIIASIFTFGLAATLFAQSVKIDEIVNPSYLNELKSKGRVSVIHPKKENVVTMVPDCFYAETIKKDLICNSDRGVPFLAEFLYVIPKSVLAEDTSVVNVDSMATVFRSISKMQGMTYIHNGGKEDILYKKSYAVATEDSFTPVADPLEGPTDGLVAYGYQHDHTFGDTKYKLEYHQNGNAIYATFLNVIPMSKLGVKAIMPGNLRMNVMSIDLGDDLLLYLSADVAAKNIVGIRDQIEDSMTVRMEAIYRWFMKQFK